MPQLSQLALVYQSQWFWLLLVLATIYFVVGRGIVSRVESTVDERDARIAADLAEAERLQAVAAETEEAWRAKINTAQAEGHVVAVEAKATAMRDAEKRVSKAEREITAKTDAAAAELAEARNAALTEIESVAAEAARDIVAKLTGAQVSEQSARAAVTGAMTRA